MTSIILQPTVHLALQSPPLYRTEATATRHVHARPLRTSSGVDASSTVTRSCLSAAAAELPGLGEITHLPPPPPAVAACHRVNDVSGRGCHRVSDVLVMCWGAWQCRVSDVSVACRCRIGACRAGVAVSVAEARPGHRWSGQVSPRLVSGQTQIRQE